MSNSFEVWERKGRTRHVVCTGFLLLSVVLSSCNDDDGHPLHGFVDARGDWVIPPRFDDVGPFMEGLAAARQGERWGYVDVRGDWVIEPQFGEAMPFSEGLAEVKTGDEFAFIDGRGNQPFDRRFQAAGAFSGGVAPVLAGKKWGLIDRRGAFVLEPVLDEIEQCTEVWWNRTACFSGGLMAAKLGELWGYLDRAGRWVIAPRFVQAGRFSEGLAAVAEQEGSVGYIDLRGRFVIAPQFEDGTWFSNGRAVVQLTAPSAAETGGPPPPPLARLALVDVEGRQVAPINWHPELFGANEDLSSAEGVLSDFPGYFDSGLLPSSRDGRWGYVDRDGKWAIEPQFDLAFPFQYGVAMVWRFPRLGTTISLTDDDFQTGLIDTRGRSVAEFAYEPVVPLGDGRFAATVNSRYGLRDADGRWILPPRFYALADEAGPLHGPGTFADTGLYPAAVLAPHHWSVLDARGGVTASGDFEWVEKLHAQAGGPDRFLVRQEGLYGIADAGLKLRVEPQYEEIEEAEDGLLEVKLNGKVGCIDVAGSTVVALEFREIEDCRRGEMLAKKAGSGWGVWAQGRGWLIEPEHESIDALWPGAYVVGSENHRRILRLARGAASGTAPEQLGGEYTEAGVTMGSEFWFVKRDDRYAIVRADSPVPDEFPIEAMETISIHVPGRPRALPWVYMVKVRIGDRWGVIDRQGRPVLPVRYEAIGASNRGGIAVKLDGRWGVVDSRGRTRFPVQFEDAQPFSEKLVAFAEAGLWGFADRNGHTVVPPRYHKVSGNTVSIGKLNGIVSDEGREIAKPVYEGAEWYYWGVWLVKDGERWQFIDEKDGSVIVEHRLAERVSRKDGGLSPAKFVLGDGPLRQLKFGYLDDRGRIVIAPRFDTAAAFEDGRARVTVGGKCGFVDRSGREVTPLRYSHCERFGAGTLVGDERPYSDPAHTRAIPGTDAG
jgi:hypothetical protein